MILSNYTVYIVLCYVIITYMKLIIFNFIIYYEINNNKLITNIFINFIYNYISEE